MQDDVSKSAVDFFLKRTFENKRARERNIKKDEAEGSEGDIKASSE